MSTKRVALYTFGIFAEPSGSPANDSFVAREPANFRAVEMSEGFVARSGYDGDPGPASWGEHAYPRFYTGDNHSPSTLSLWRYLASPMAFSYSGIHAEALRHGREWFVKPQWPGYVLWWVDGDHTPDWSEGVVRHEYLHDNGPSAYAFTFKEAFDQDNQPITISHQELKRIIDINAIGQQLLIDAGAST